MAEKCACKGDYLDKFIQPAILALICRRPAHGFFLLSELEKQGLVSDIDTTGFYRTLRKLEEDGKLSSVWNIEAGEKPKKVYSLTPAGLDCLKNWQKTLQEYIVQISAISRAVDKALEGKVRETEAEK